MESFLNLLLEISRGLGITLGLFALTLLITIPLGLLGSQVSLSKYKPVRRIYGVYLYIFRGTPLLLQLLFLYFGLNFAGASIDKFSASVLAFALNYTAYFSEIFRGGIQSISRGQFEAASVLGLPKRLTMRKIVIPQVFKITMPSISNEVVTLVKDTALVNILALVDVLQAARSAVNRTSTITPFIVAFVFYLALNALVQVVLQAIEKRMNYYKI